jgi:DNA-binding response OmpR family regulator
MVSKVLLLEPYADLRSEIAATLRRADYACDAVATVAAAAAELDLRTYDYVVMDADDVDSFRLAAAIDPASRVILLTCEDADPSALRKPFSRAELMARFAH